MTIIQQTTNNPLKLNTNKRNIAFCTREDATAFFRMGHLKRNTSTFYRLKQIKSFLNSNTKNQPLRQTLTNQPFLAQKLPPFQIQKKNKSKQQKSVLTKKLIAEVLLLLFNPQSLLMNSNQLLKLSENKPQLETKPSREERKILEAIARLEKEEAYRAEQKKRLIQKEVSITRDPRKQPKIQIPISSDTNSPENLHQGDTNRLTEDADRTEREEKSQVEQKVVNPGYKLNVQDDLFMHLIKYRETQKDKHSKKCDKSLLGMPYNLNKQEIMVINQEGLMSTSTAFSKIQSKFEESRSKLRKPNAKEHKQFQTRYLTEDFLKN